MSKKPQKVEESASPYAAKKPAKAEPATKSAAPGRQLATDAAFKRVTDKIFSERKELLHKLAQ